MEVNENDVLEARETAQRLNLNGADILFSTSEEVIKEVCNGIGPEWFPEKLRKLVDALHPSLRVPAMIHDLRYYFGTGTDEDFKNANNDFECNGIAVAKDLYSWYDPRRYMAIHKARQFAKLCDGFGRVAYDAAIKERQSKEQLEATKKNAQPAKTEQAEENAAQTAVAEENAKKIVTEEKGEATAEATKEASAGGVMAEIKEKCSEQLKKTVVKTLKNAVKSLENKDDGTSETKHKSKKKSRSKKKGDEECLTKTEEKKQKTSNSASKGKQKSEEQSSKSGKKSSTSSQKQSAVSTTSGSRKEDAK